MKSIRKILLPCLSLLMVFGIIACDKPNPTFDNIPLSISNTWHIVDESEAYLEFHIKNESNRSIKEIRCVRIVNHSYDVDDEMISFDMSWSSFTLYSSEIHEPLKKDQTIIVSYRTSIGDPSVHTVNARLYITYIEFAWPATHHWGDKNFVFNSLNEAALNGHSALFNMEPYTKI